eukprot:tig00022099_g23811.t1
MADEEQKEPDLAEEAGGPSTGSPEDGAPASDEGAAAEAAEAAGGPPAGEVVVIEPEEENGLRITLEKEPEAEPSSPAPKPAAPPSAEPGSRGLVASTASKSAPALPTAHKSTSPEPRAHMQTMTRASTSPGPVRASSASLGGTNKSLSRSASADEVPGPGTYSARSYIGIGPRFSMPGKYPRPDERMRTGVHMGQWSPGPAAYRDYGMFTSPNGMGRMGEAKQAVHAFPQAKRFDFGQGQEKALVRSKSAGAVVPGPGAYQNINPQHFGTAPGIKFTRQDQRPIPDRPHRTPFVSKYYISVMNSGVHSPGPAHYTPINPAIQVGAEVPKIPFGTDPRRPIGMFKVPELREAPGPGQYTLKGTIGKGADPTTPVGPAIRIGTAEQRPNFTEHINKVPYMGKQYKGLNPVGVESPGPKYARDSSFLAKDTVEKHGAHFSFTRGPRFVKQVAPLKSFDITRQSAPKAVARPPAPGFGPSPFTATAS